jgi:hypothetical protein
MILDDRMPARGDLSGGTQGRRPKPFTPADLRDQARNPLHASTKASTAGALSLVRWAKTMMVTRS